jgi:hypothetical protein
MAALSSANSRGPQGGAWPQVNSSAVFHRAFLCCPDEVRVWLGHASPLLKLGSAHESKNVVEHLDSEEFDRLRPIRRCGAGTPGLRIILEALNVFRLR